MDGLNLDHQTTPMGLIVPPQETVTIVDPRHPLCGRTLPLVGIMNSSGRGRCCVVWIRPTVERHVPVAATNLEYDPNSLHPLPLSLTALQQFLQEFAYVAQATKGGSLDEPSEPLAPERLTPAGVEDLDGDTTGSGVRYPGADVPGMSPPGGAA